MCMAHLRSLSWYPASLQRDRLARTIAEPTVDQAQQSSTLGSPAERFFSRPSLERRAGCKLQAGSVWLSMGSSALMVKICCTVILGKSELIVYKSSLSFSPPVTTTDRQFSWVHESSATLSCLKVTLTRSTVSYAIKPSQSTSLIVTDSLNGTKLWR